MDGGVTASAPTGTAVYKRRVRNIADVDVPAHGMNLRMAFEAKVVVPLDQHLVGDGTVGRMADGAAFAQGFVLVNKHSRLFSMTARATFIQACHARLRAHPESRAVRGPINICAVRIMALHTVHPAFENGMVVRKFELGMDIEMAGETGLRFQARIHDKLSTPASGFYVQAARSMTGLAASRFGLRGTLELQPCMGARVKRTGELGMAILAGRIADKSCPLDRRRCHAGASQAGTGDKRAC